MKRLIFLYVPEDKEEEKEKDPILPSKEEMDILAEAYREAGYEFGSQ